MSNFNAVLHDPFAMKLAVAIVVLLIVFENWRYWTRNWRSRHVQYVAASLGVAALVASITFFSDQKSMMSLPSGQVLEPSAKSSPQQTALVRPQSRLRVEWLGSLLDSSGIR